MKQTHRTGTATKKTYPEYLGGSAGSRRGRLYQDPAADGELQAKRDAAAARAILNATDKTLQALKAPANFSPDQTAAARAKVTTTTNAEFMALSARGRERWQILKKHFERTGLAGENLADALVVFSPDTLKGISRAIEAAARKIHTTEKKYNKGA